MFEYDRIDISEGIVDTTQNKLVSRECIFRHFWYLIDKNFSYQRYFCDGCHDMSVESMSMKDLVIIYSGGNAYRVILSFMTFDEANNLINNSNITSKRGVL